MYIISQNQHQSVGYENTYLGMESITLWLTAWDSEAVTLKHIDLNGWE